MHLYECICLYGVFCNNNMIVLNQVFIKRQVYLSNLIINDQNACDKTYTVFNLMSFYIFNK